MAKSDKFGGPRASAGKGKGDKGSPKAAASGSVYGGALAVALFAALAYAALSGHARPQPAATRPEAERAAATAATETSVAPVTAKRAAALFGADPECVDLSADCAAWQQQGECDKNPSYMHGSCPRSCGTCGAERPAEGQCSGGGDETARSAAIEAVVGVTPERQAEMLARFPKCKNKSDDCAQWAARGECATNPRYMRVSCAMACDTCEMSDYSTRCVADPDAVPAVRAGEIDAMFARIDGGAFAHLQPRVLSRAPWVVVFDAFMSEAEAAAIVAVVNRDNGTHFTVSQGTGNIDEDSNLIATVSDYRTSFTNWCEDNCINDTAVKAVRERVVELTGVPDTNHEFPQALRYYPGQYYNEHHDYIPAHKHMLCGPRVYTMFLYLSNVTKGGQTRFTKLDLNVEPRVGRAVLWPSTLSDAPMDIDERTHHVAMPVEEGIKFSVNLWLHMFDFKKANAKQCTG